MSYGTGPVKPKKIKVKKMGTQTADLGMITEGVNWLTQNPGAIAGGLGAVNAVIWGKAYSNFKKMRQRNKKIMNRGK